MNEPLYPTNTFQRSLFLLSAACCLVSISSFTNLIPPQQQNNGKAKGSSALEMSSEFGQDDQAAEAIRSLCDFHEGQWEGTATSFSITPDVAAGIVKRETSPKFKVGVKLGLDENRQLSLTETFEWNDDNFSSRLLLLNDCNMDVDSVDASYSLDSSLPDFPARIAGTDKLIQFGIEHCIAASNDRRTKCFAFYGLDQSLQRIVVTDENRIKDSAPPPPAPSKGAPPNDQLTARDLLEMESDIDRLVEKITGNMENKPSSSSPTPVPSSPLEQLGNSMSSKDDGSKPLASHDISLLELSSGVWLGDAIIRDQPTVPESPGGRGRGFGSSGATPTSDSTKAAFGSWEVGVQKIAWRWMWNFGEEIRQVVDNGKAMGASLAKTMTKSLGGNVCVNEGLSRRIPKDQRMVYIDWSGDMVGFLSGPVSIQVPRYLNFDKEATKDLNKPFFTEFCLYQSEDDAPVEIGELDEAKLPEVCCSKLSRVYNYAGQLKQGISSFYTFKRFGMEEDN
ncbi:unnamed protein product [Cylindrotheca closterium]|uniref:Uncharacterized protein n=1 Tax=Cylindrotheca closterium TaxID=2856 RepID=A0AAD2GCV9_9STRA|nr:unnamed protein product [Cylindrotheca closterium]